MNEDFMMQLDDMHLQQAQAVRRPTLLNIAVAQLRKVGGGGGGGAPAALLCRLGSRAVLSLHRCAPLQAPRLTMTWSSGRPVPLLLHKLHRISFNLFILMGASNISFHCCWITKWQEDYHGAIATCGEVLTEDPTNAKALFRWVAQRWCMCPACVSSCVGPAPHPFSALWPACPASGAPARSSCCPARLPPISLHPLALAGAARRGLRWARLRGRWLIWRQRIGRSPEMAALRGSWRRRGERQERWVQVVL